MTRAKRHLVSDVGPDVHCVLIVDDTSVLLETRLQCNMAGRF